MRILRSGSCSPAASFVFHHPRRSIPRSLAPPVLSSSIPNICSSTTRQRCSYRVPRATELSASSTDSFGSDSDRTRAALREVDDVAALILRDEISMARGRSVLKIEGRRGFDRHGAVGLDAVSILWAAGRKWCHITALTRGQQGQHTPASSAVSSAANQRRLLVLLKMVDKASKLGAEERMMLINQIRDPAESDVF